MKQNTTIILALTVLLSTSYGCAIDKGMQYDENMQTLTIKAIYPDGFESYAREGVKIKIEEINNGNSYSAQTDSTGKASVILSDGIYRVLVSDRHEEFFFNGTADNIRLVNGDMELSINLIRSKTGTILIKEIYCGGCLRSPQEGEYQFDKYIILHNNSPQTQYLDSLCFGSLDPYNSQGTNVWVDNDENTGASIYQDFSPIIQAVWQFGGNGSSFPIETGEDAVIAVCGAIDHASQYPLSVNLNKPGYFVCYNSTYFPNTLYHPAPGDNISPDRYLNVVIKTGVANAYPLSIFSPAIVIFKAEGTTIQDFVKDPLNVVQKPGSKYDYVVKIPMEWIIDGVEVFYGGSSKNTKRLSPEIDAGYVTQSDIYLGHTLFRHTDEQASEISGYEILMDTNNSSTDFYERTQQSLHE